MQVGCCATGCPLPFSRHPTHPTTTPSPLNAPQTRCRAIFLNYHKLQGWPALAAIHVADTARALEALTDEQVVEEGLAALRRMYGAAAVPAPVQANVTRWAADPFSLGSYSYFAVGNPKNITGARKQAVPPPHDHGLPAACLRDTAVPQPTPRLLPPLPLPPACRAAALAEPTGRVLWAGEATSTKPATGKGAEANAVCHGTSSDCGGRELRERPTPPASLPPPTPHPSPTVLGAYLSGLREAARLQELLPAEGLVPAGGAAPAAEAAE